jgi:hypothetical protein
LIPRLPRLGSPEVFPKNRLYLLPIRGRRSTVIACRRVEVRGEGRRYLVQIADCEANLSVDCVVPTVAKSVDNIDGKRLANCFDHTVCSSRVHQDVTQLVRDLVDEMCALVVFIDVTVKVKIDLNM